MRLTPPTNATFWISVLLGLVSVIAGFTIGFTISTYLALAALLVLMLGNLFEKQ